MQKRRILTIVLALGLTAAAAFANETKNPTIITSDGPLNADFQNKLAVFKDNVVVKDDQGTINADKMNVHFAKDNQIQKVECYGNVKITQEGRYSESQEAVYFALEKKIILTGDPVIRQGSDQYRAEKITIFTSENRVVFEPSAELMIFPDEGNGKNLDFFNQGE